MTHIAFVRSFLGVYVPVRLLDRNAEKHSSRNGENGKHGNTNKTYVNAHDA
jgi:hypothetical protein